MKGFIKLLYAYSLSNLSFKTSIVSSKGCSPPSVINYVLLSIPVPSFLMSLLPRVIFLCICITNSSQHSFTNICALRVSAFFVRHHQELVNTLGPLYITRISLYTLTL